jgi:hypothetical protein
VGNFLAVAFLRNRALPHRRHRFAATKICTSCFAASLPQDSSAQLMFDLGEIPAARLSRSFDLGFGADQCGGLRGASARMPHKCLSGRRI